MSLTQFSPAAASLPRSILHPTKGASPEPARSGGSAAADGRRSAVAEISPSIFLISHGAPSPTRSCNKLQPALRLPHLLIPEDFKSTTINTSIPSCNRLQRQLQLAAFLRSVDYAGLKSDLNPFRINTSRNVCTFRIPLISCHLKSPIINTSRKHGGWGVQLQLQLQLATAAFLPAGGRRHPQESATKDLSVVPATAATVDMP